ncbi:hypothetical protein [Chondromyces crocatus]|uniref:hypothetical protein n=1 Tax=Chondromyces crocatus TaxID=52 RepID=UPI00146FEA61|nr:hypothetical protein [Chondromyces crocatus]
MIRKEFDEALSRIRDEVALASNATAGKGMRVTHCAAAASSGQLLATRLEFAEGLMTGVRSMVPDEERPSLLHGQPDLGSDVASRWGNAMFITCAHTKTEADMAQLGTELALVATSLADMERSVRERLDAVPCPRSAAR